MQLMSSILILFLTTLFVRNSKLKTFENNYSQTGRNFNNFHKSRSIFKRSILRNMQENWTSPIYYYIHPDLKRYRHIISATVQSLSSRTCLRFIESNTSIEHRIGIIFILLEYGCMAYVGRNRNVKNNPVYLSHYCAQSPGSIIHEFLHALGLRHEQTRYDRDHYITINKQNLKSGLNLNNDLLGLENLEQFTIFNDIPYDYGSIMHYPRYSFSKVPSYLNDERYNTMEAKNIKLYTLMLGQLEKMSFSDVKTLNYYYCSNKCKASEVKCKNGGYKHFDERLCGRCVCPERYYGEDCSHVMQVPSNCSHVDLVARDSYDLIEENGNKFCNYRIKTQKNKTIHMVLFVKTKYKKICASGIGLEVKYLINKGVTGLCICGKHDNIHIVSEGDEIYMEYNNLHSNYGFKAYYAIAPSDQNTSIICDEDSCFEKNGKYYEKVNKTYKAFSYTLVSKETLILYRTNNSFEEHFVPSDEDYYNGSFNRYNETIF